jgi:predicted N-acetyltransferase YhbS
MVTVRQERPGEAAVREALLDLAYGPARFTKTSERLREGRAPELALVAREGGRIVGTVRLWSVKFPLPNPPPQAGEGKGGGALLLGPLAVDPGCRSRGIGSTLVQQALRQAARRGHRAVLLVGDAPFYARFGFSSEKTGALSLPGPYERHRLLGLELQPGALDGARGLISTPAAPARQPALAAPKLAPRADEPASGRVSPARSRASSDALCARTLESPRWPLASLASAAGAA